HITIAANPGDVVIIDDEGNTPEWEGAFQAEGKAFFDIYDIEICLDQKRAKLRWNLAREINNRCAASTPILLDPGQLAGSTGSSGSHQAIRTVCVWQVRPAA
ncbi:MAG: hypothetical protein J7M25_11120, partial [Deltaproteobacteria bacterium]|nr:hypothetical protein [Deltaproteobacteria bacterium]